MPTHFIELVKTGETADIAAAVDTNSALAGSKDETGVSALMWAVYTGRTLVRDFLLSRRSEDSIDIFEAASCGNLGRLRALIKAEADSLKKFSPDGWTPLHLASAFGGPQVVKDLLLTGADPNQYSKNALKNLPLHACLALSKSPESVALLLKHGADVNAKQHGGFTPLHQAAAAGDIENIKQLLAHGADPTASTNDGKTALEFAQTRGKQEAAALLQHAVARTKNRA